MIVMAQEFAEQLKEIILEIQRGNITIVMVEVEHPKPLPELHETKYNETNFKVLWYQNE